MTDKQPTQDIEKIKQELPDGDEPTALANSALAEDDEPQGEGLLLTDAPGAEEYQKCAARSKSLRENGCWVDSDALKKQGFVCPGGDFDCDQCFIENGILAILKGKEG